MITKIDTKKCLIIGAVITQKYDVERFLALFRNFCNRYKVEGQILNADFVVGVEHIKSAVYHAIRAFQTGTNTCKTISLEILLYAAAEKQLKNAFAKIGIRKGNRKIAIVTVGDKLPFTAEMLTTYLNVQRNDKVLEPLYSKLVRFGIGSKELKSVCKNAHQLVLEKVAFVELLK